MTRKDVLYRRAEKEDYAGILRLQSANYIANLPQQERREGFLSAEFTPEQLATLATDLGITVALDAGNVAGYLCAFRNDFNHGSPVLEKMLESYDRVQFNGQPLNSYSSYIYGPVCISREYRRRGILRGLYDVQKRDLAGQFEIGVAFVSRDNPHSLTAHLAGLGMTGVGDFEANGKVYVILAFVL